MSAETNLATMRFAHQVMRTTNLKKTLSFLEAVFGMSTIRHEENEAKCDITCNGKFDRPWMPQN